MMTRRSALLLVAAAWACSRPTEVEGTPRPAVTEANVVFSDLLEIRAARDTLDLVNKTRHVVYYFLSEREGVAVVVPTAPCDDPARCPGVTARDQFRIAYADIPGLSPSATEVVVLHWRLVPAATQSGFRPDSIRAAIVRVR